MDVGEITVNKSSAEAKQIIKAFEFAKKAHAGQKRLSGDDYFVHLFEVAKILNQLELDATTIIAGLLHDTLEDTQVTEQELKTEFGEKVLFLVQGATKIKNIERQKKERKATSNSTLMKMFLATAEDLRVILIKLVDRLHNLRTIEYLPPEKRKIIAEESIKIYAPIAERLNMGSIKGEIEDLAFPHAFPDKYEQFMATVEPYFQEAKSYATKILPVITAHLKENGITDFALDSRIKHYYSLYKKILRSGKAPDQIFDIIAFRVIVGDIGKCYEALGVIHKKYHPLPGLIKDYIALPKPNGYQSLHTTVFFEEGRVVEFQIRTVEMHDHAEHGIAAHWAYSESGKPKTSSADFKELEWVSQIKEWRAKVREQNPDEFFKNLKGSLFKERIFVFTPQGDIENLPLGATPLDFAYAIHSEIGDHYYGARVNGKMISIGYQLKNMEVCEVLTSKKQKPTSDWLKFAKTNEAKRRIRGFLAG